MTLNAELSDDLYLCFRWSFRETPNALRDRYWIAEQGRWRLHPTIRRMVSFARVNLAERCYPAITNGTCALDLIVCRNVTIYFDAATTRQVAARFYRALAPGGWLIVGHAEPQASIYHQFEVHNFPNTVIYRKPLDAPLFAVDPASAVFNAGPHPILASRAMTDNRQPLPAPPPGAALTGQRRTGTDGQQLGTHTLQQPAASSQRLNQRPPPVVSGQPSPTSHDRWPAIVARLAQGDPAGAEPLLSDLLDADPAHVPARTALGQLYADRGEWARARQQCLLALDQDPLCVPAHYLLAQIHRHQGQLDAALAAYRRTVYLDRAWVLGMLGMANVWRRMGRPLDAQRCYRNALAQLTDLPPVPGANGATASELGALAAHQLQGLAAAGSGASPEGQRNQMP
jgi:chemotaxis protein methyltransferase CheR